MLYFIQQFGILVDILAEMLYFVQEFRDPGRHSGQRMYGAQAGEIRGNRPCEQIHNKLYPEKPTFCSASSLVKISQCEISGLRINVIPVENLLGAYALVHK